MGAQAQETRTRTRDWADCNRAYLDAQVLRLRLVLARRVLWLRRQWESEPRDG